MILSHRHRFIFIKTPKTAGTSIEMGLRPLCGPEDVVTPLLEDAQEGGRNYMRGPMPFRYARDFYNHMPISLVAKYAPEAVSSYFKFAVVRNPWDRQVSQSCWRKHRGLKKETVFTEWILQIKPMVVLPLLRREGRLAVDFVARYERLEEDFATVCARIGIPVPELPREKSGHRDHTDYRDYYDPRARQRVAEMYAREIALFGYEF